MEETGACGALPERLTHTHTSRASFASPCSSEADEPTSLCAANRRNPRRPHECPEPRDTETARGTPRQLGQCHRRWIPANGRDSECHSLLKPNESTSTLIEVRRSPRPRWYPHRASSARPTPRPAAIVLP